MIGGDYSGDGDHAELADTLGHSKAWSDVRCMPMEFETDLKPVAKPTPDATGDKRCARKRTLPARDHGAYASGARPVMKAALDAGRTGRALRPARVAAGLRDACTVPDSPTLARTAVGARGAGRTSRSVNTCGARRPNEQLQHQGLSARAAAASK
jgi:hypothetical protein